MRVPELAALYALAGCGSAIALVVRRPHGTDVVDVVLLAIFWPLYGPFLLMQGAESQAGTQDAFLRANGSPLAGLLPDEGEAAALKHRLRHAEGRIGEIDRLLARPDFSEQTAEKRLEELGVRRASTTAMTSASLRLQNLRRLRALRDKFARELDEIRELLAQIVTQAEVVRLAGREEESVEGLVRELLHRMDGLDVMFDECAPAAATDPGDRESA